ncbi:MAG: neutral zinc metallopeptidase [Myxococcales bacterium]|nr:neutral zinc metallopeptidase [Myxococcales bacterium]
MRTEGRRRSSHFEDRGAGAGGGGGGVPIQALASVVRLFGWKGALIVAVVLGVGYFVLPSALKQQLLGALAGGGQQSGKGRGAGSVCEASPTNAKACDFSRVVLASTEDVWMPVFKSAGSGAASTAATPGSATPSRSRTTRSCELGLLAHRPRRRSRAAGRRARPR